MDSGSDQEVVTHIKYEKTSCYFCNEWLDAESFPVSLLLNSKNESVFCGSLKRFKKNVYVEVSDSFFTNVCYFHIS